MSGDIYDPAIHKSITLPQSIWQKIYALQKVPEGTEGRPRSQAEILRELVLEALEARKEKRGL